MAAESWLEDDRLAAAELSALLRETTAAVLQRSDPARLMSYHPGAGAIGEQRAGAAWPSALVLVSPASTLPPALAAKLTGAPATGFPAASLSRTVGLWATAVPAIPV